MLLCFLLAATFWVLKALNKRYENVRISYPIAFAYNPENLIPVTEPPAEIIINVDGKGWKLLRKALNLRIRPAIIDLNNRSAIRYLTSRQLRPNISAALNGLDLNYIVTDTIYFNFEKLATRKLRLELTLPDTALATGYELAGKINISPTQVMVSGPASLVNAIPEPYPLHLPDSGITENYDREIPLGFMPKELLKPNVEEVHVSFKVTQLAKNEIQLPVNLRNPDSLGRLVAVKPALVKLTYYVAPSAAKPDSAAFLLEADLTNINPKDSTVSVKIARKPATVKTISVSPQKVKVVY